MKVSAFLHTISKDTAFCCGLLGGWWETETLCQVICDKTRNYKSCLPWLYYCRRDKSMDGDFQDGGQNAF